MAYENFSDALDEAIRLKEALFVTTVVVEDSGIYYVVGSTMVPPERENHIVARLSEIFYADYMADATAVYGTYTTE